MISSYSHLELDVNSQRILELTINYPADEWDSITDEEYANIEDSIFALQSDEFNRQLETSENTWPSPSGDLVYIKVHAAICRADQINQTLISKLKTCPLEIPTSKIEAVTTTRKPKAAATFF